MHFTGIIDLRRDRQTECGETRIHNYMIILDNIGPESALLYTGNRYTIIT
jgi:hypothetical protein